MSDSDAPLMEPQVIREPRPEVSSLEPESEELKLSPYTQALVDSFKNVKKRLLPDDLSKLSVSQTVSFLAIAYEKARNAIEYREDHLVLRAAIERILKRRLALNPQGEGEAENLLRELLWARYFDNESLGDKDVEQIQKIIDRYLAIKNALLTDHNKHNHVYLFQYLFEFLTCEIEEDLNPEATKVSASNTYFIFQTLREKIKVEGLEEDKKDAYFLAALDKAYRKSDTPYQRYHLFTTFYQPLSQIDLQELEELQHNLPAVFKKIDEIIANPYVDSLTKFVKKQLPPYLILFDIFEKHKHDVSKVLTNKKTLWEEVEAMCNEKYKQVADRLRGLAIRSLIYIFITKMLFALVLEYPVSMFFYNEVHTTSILINALFPPFLMMVIVLFFKLPGPGNTKNIFNKIVGIIDADKSFETHVALLKKKGEKKSLRIFIFTVVYSLTFLLTLYLIHKGLDALQFNLISQALFIFFISVVSFFSYRIKQVVNEYKINEREGVLGPVIDFFFLPILALGKFFSSGISKLNLFIVLFDFIIEAPFKLIIEIFEEWIKFVRARKEEIV